MLKAYKFRLYPTVEQIVLLEKHFGASRFIYNHFLVLSKKEKEMKKLFLIMASLLFMTGCSETKFDDKDMTEAFFKKHGSEFTNGMSEASASLVFSEWKITYRLNHGISFQELEPKDGERFCEPYYVSFEKGIFFNKLVFEERDIKKYGKDKMFEYAEECFKWIANEVNEREKIKQLGVENLNKKFTLPNK